MTTTAEEKAKAERLKERKEVRQALQQTATTKAEVKPVVETRGKVWLLTYVLLLLALGSIYYLLRLGVFAFAGKYAALSQRLVLGLIVISIIFANWYTTVVSLGLISLILGFALQTPITSFIGWIYILVRAPYRVGDRIRIGDATGDVIGVNYLDTTLWEFGGQYLSTDHPSGRIIKFPNSNVLTTPVYNYSWPLFPYLWNEIKFQIAYDADLEFISGTMRRVAEKEVGEAMMKHVEVFRQLLAQ